MASLKARLVLEQERRDNAEANVESIREEEGQMTEKMFEESKNTRRMVTKMTEIYKKMEKEYNEKIEKAELQVEEQEK